MMDTERKLVAEKLRTAREYLGLSQEEVAASVSISRSAISLVENGQRKVDSLELKAFANLYQQPVSFFTGENEQLGARPEFHALARQVSKLSSEDRDEVLRFAEYLWNKSKGE